MDPLRRVVAGSRLAPSATAWNRFCDLAKRDRRGLLEGPSDRVIQPLDGSLLRARSTESETAIPRFGIVALRAPVADPTTHEDAFFENACLDCSAPTGPEDTSRIAVAMTPILPGQIGRVQHLGFATVRINITDPEATTASATNSEVHLETDSSGAIPIMWRDPGESGVVRAIVRLGAPIATVGAVVKSGTIVAVTETGSASTLGYQGYLVARHEDVGVDLLAASGSIIPCVNGFELSADLQTQVQDESPGAKTLLRLPIGTPVFNIMRLPCTSGELWGFEKSDAYAVDCP